MKKLTSLLILLLCLLMLAPTALAMSPAFCTPAASVQPAPSGPSRAGDLPLSGYVIGVDPGHQAKANNGKEPVAPGSKTLKKKVSSGTQGRWSRVPEYKVTLAVGLLVRDKLEALGATVVMTRETNNVNISNIARAQIFNEAKTDYAVRLHCNGSNNSSVNGAFILIPYKHPCKAECKRAAELLIKSFCKATGAKNLGITARSDQTGFNWCERMIINIEMGHMTNKKEDKLLTSAAYQEKMAQGIVDGILAYFKK
jgi:N-acetylmuramoyl-L-alanine amidase